MLTTPAGAFVAIVMLSMAVFGFQSLALALIYWHHRGGAYWNRRRAPGVCPPHQPPPTTWPAVTVQLPIYNERFVVARLIDAVCALDYPRHAFSVQVLDDSTDVTTCLARARVAHHRAQGIDIQWVHRTVRTGYKAGALAAGLATAQGEYIAIFDADFVPPPDFLRHLIPYLAADTGLGFVQARCGHLNHAATLLTRGQALALDSHFVVIQTARCHAGLPLNFNGTAGIWRRRCIEDAGGWSAETLTEDLDLSYRAQIKGWRARYLPHVVVPGEIPTGIAAYKRQQYRWVCGGIAVFKKLGGALWCAPLGRRQRIFGLLHLASYLANPLMLLFLLALPPLLLQEGKLPALPWLWPAGLGLPLLAFFSQWDAYTDWPRRLLYAPVLACLSVGLTLNNTRAVVAGLGARGSPVFLRTPKCPARAVHHRRIDAAALAASYTVQSGWSVWGEWALAIYAAGACYLAWTRATYLLPVLLLYTLGFGFCATQGIYEKRRTP